MASDMQTNISGATAPHSSAALGDVVLKTEGLTKHYGGVHALEDANFEIRKGEHVAIMGDNGAGKSTFVRQITAVEQRTRGQIWFNGDEVHFEGPLEAREAGIETVFQTLALADDLNVPDNLFLGRELVKFRFGPFSILDYKAMREATIAGLEKTAVKIPNISQAIRNMSGGQRQCVAIARTATFHSKLTIMDEPTAALGVQETAQVENIIRTLKDAGEPLILISHNMRQVMDLMDRIVVFRRGRIVANLRKEDTDGQDVVAYITGAKTQPEYAVEGAL
jgi:fructose transport system ATP-binding protein